MEPDLFLDWLGHGYCPLVLNSGGKMVMLPFDTRGVMTWLDGPGQMPAQSLVAFPCLESGLGPSRLERARQHLVAETYLARGYIGPDQLTPGGARRGGYADPLNRRGWQISMAMTDGLGAGLTGSLRMVLPALEGYELADRDSQGRPVCHHIQPGELPMHALLGAPGSDRAGQLMARTRLHVLGEFSQLVNLPGEPPIAPALCDMVRRFARRLLAPPYRPWLFDDGWGVAVAVSTVPRLTPVLARIFEQHVALPLAGLARAEVVQVAPRAWRMGSEEVPQLLMVRAQD